MNYYCSRPRPKDPRQIQRGLSRQSRAVASMTNQSSQKPGPASSPSPIAQVADMSVSELRDTNERQRPAAGRGLRGCRRLTYGSTCGYGVADNERLRLIGRASAGSAQQLLRSPQCYQPVGSIILSDSSHDTQARVRVRQPALLLVLISPFMFHP